LAVTGERRARLTRHEHELGAWVRARRPPAPQLAPKLAARLLRFDDVRRRIELDPPRWGEIAFDAGYADQSHLNREFQAFAGITPTDFMARLIPQGGLVGDGCAPAA
jgi:AraC-like DNA-binding protein